MQILSKGVMRGPNYWCPNRHKLIVLSLALQESEFFDNEYGRVISDRMAAMFPYKRRNLEINFLADLTGQIVLELQSLSGLDCAYFKTHPTCNPNRFYLVYSYAEEQSGLYAADVALRIAQALNAGESYELENDLYMLKQLHRRGQLGPSTKSIVDEAIKRGIPVRRLDRHSLIMLGHGCNQRTFRATVAGTTNSLAVEQVSDKDGTKNILSKNFIPVPQGLVISEKSKLQDCLTDLNFPLVVKPLDGNHGKGITTGIMQLEQLEEAFQHAQKFSEHVIIEQHIEGSDYRFLLVDYKLVAVAKRVPARVIGDGRSSIRQLVEQVNKDPRRGQGHEKELTAIKFDAATLKRLANKDLSPEDVLPADQVLDLKDTANISTGGTAEDVTDLVHPENVFLAERVARLLDLNICGIDVMTPDVTKPIAKTNGAVLEVNAGPGLRMHLAPTIGRARNVAIPILDMLYPANQPSRIPLVAVTGTNGKTTTTRLIAHLAKFAGLKVGFTTTDGIFIDGNMVSAGDCSGPASAEIVLRDPVVEFAVLECARGGILRSGLGFDRCTVSVVTNVSSDHLGLKDIETVEQLSKIKAVVPASTSSDGYAILNADDDLVYNMRHGLVCNIALFSLDVNNPRVVTHVAAGGLAVVVEDGNFVIINKQEKATVASIEEVPLTIRGQAACMVKNVLPAILSSYIHKFPIELIRAGLMEFIPSAENTPGRMNEFNIGDVKLLVDYAHNEGGYAELKKYASNIAASRKTGIIACPGDRRNQDIIMMGRCAAEIFDTIIIRHDKEDRGRSDEEITELLMQGIYQIDRAKPVIVVSDELDALDYALEHRISNEWIFMNPEYIPEVLDYIKEITSYESMADTS
jgi:cyanophycin synthetase